MSSQQQLTGLRFMFQKKFLGTWGRMAFLLPCLAYGLYMQNEYDKAAYAMRGRSNLYKRQAELLEQSGTGRPLWK